MSFELPNLPDTSYIDQAEPDRGDFVALGERNTGVLSGCGVTAQGSPALAVDVSSGAVVVGGVSVAVTGGAVAIIAGEAQPRFDLVVVDNTGAKLVIKGTASTNPRFPSFDPLTYCWLNAVYVRQSVTSILPTDLVDKRATLPLSFSRVYGDDTTEMLGSTNSATTKTFKVMSSGEHRWMSSILRRTGDAAMEFATSLTLKAADSALAVLKLKATLNPSVEKLLDVQNSAGTTIASVNGLGQIAADNFKTGVIPPEGSVVGNKGDVYVNRGFSTADAAIYIKSSDGGNTGWVAMGTYAPTVQALAPGSVYAWIGNPASPPTGSVYMNGQLLSSTDVANANLLAIVANTYGGTPGVNFAVPDWRNVSPMGAGSIVSLGQIAGAAEITLTEAQMPSHYHALHDAGHVHPVEGFPWLWKPASEPTANRPYPANLPPVNNISSLPYMQPADFNFEGLAASNISIDAAGGGQFVDNLSPVVGCHWLVRK